MQTTVKSLDDIRIGVINNGPYEPTWFYDGKPYTYTARTQTNKTAITGVPWKIAEHHWALALKEDADGKLKVVRKTWTEPNDRDSLLDSRLATVCSKVYHKPNPDLPGHYIDDPETRKWFLDKVQFKLKAIKQTMTEEEFLS